MKNPSRSRWHFAGTLTVIALIGLITATTAIGHSATGAVSSSQDCYTICVPPALDVGQANDAVCGVTCDVDQSIVLIDLGACSEKSGQMTARSWAAGTYPTNHLGKLSMTAALNTSDSKMSPDANYSYAIRDDDVTTAGRPRAAMRTRSPKAPALRI